MHLLVKLLLHLAEVREARQHVMELLERSRCSVEQGGWPGKWNVGIVGDN